MGFLSTPPKNVKDIPYCNHTNYGALIRQVNVLWKNDPTLPDSSCVQYVFSNLHKMQIRMGGWWLEKMSAVQITLGGGGWILYKKWKLYILLDDLWSSLTKTQ